MNESNSFILPQVLGSAVSADPLALLNGNESLQRLGQVIPEYKLEYNRSSDPGLKAGLFSSSLGGQKEMIEATILAMTFSRQMFGDYDPSSTDNGPLCSSSNGETPDGGSSPCLGPCERLDAQGHLTVSCPHAQWKDGKRPECSEVFTILGWDWEEASLFKFSFKGSSIKHLNRLKARISSVRKWGYPGLPTNACVKLRLCIKKVSNWFECHMPLTGLQGEPYWEKLPLDEVKVLLEEVGEAMAQFQRLKAPRPLVPSPPPEPQDPRFASGSVDQLPF